MTYAQRVAELEAEGLTTSDAQAVADAEQMRGREFDFDPGYPREQWENDQAAILEYENWYLHKTIMEADAEFLSEQ